MALGHLQKWPKNIVSPTTYNNLKLLLKDPFEQIFTRGHSLLKLYLELPTLVIVKTRGFFNTIFGYSKIVYNEAWCLLVGQYFIWQKLNFYSDKNLMLKIELTFFRLEVYGSIVKDSPSRQKALGSIGAHTNTPTSFFVPTFLIVNTYIHAYIHPCWERRVDRRGGKTEEEERREERGEWNFFR